MTIILTPAQAKYLTFIIKNDLEALEGMVESNDADGSDIAEGIHARAILAKLEQQ